MLPKNASLRHVALAVNKLDECEQFYNLLGMRTELKTPDYIYLAGNGDSILLHKVQSNFEVSQRLEHIGFALDSVQAVEQVFKDLQKSGLNILYPPKTFGIGTHSFSVFDPDGIEVEFTYHPPMWEYHDN
ncbi:TPA: glyoxalase/bleomycin resistance/dioxygenase family protein [Legionella pneumophila]|nr:VOC family protein [Legionella pneumophila]HAT8869216.1 glyoxalase/bleomycin resistance/dioxygenase family protein [Legionella pneumophila subsp. pneumophila]HAT7072041.1 glyoxalase/bleomycin resistance/dioxygenase family protein [Legionella pneumophila]HAT8642977.1 glyoxalase/bleomycin resistance/dioxygenase family protein [Legionella pneumophila]HAT8891263.1 glyoxalase/bleomycin resistance/dioxygenase family protein [Legionella pneumophila subsp. pneumophila]HAT8932220.1 glyoxalase/bleomy